MKKAGRLLPVLMIFWTLFSCDKQAIRVKNVVIHENKGDGEQIVLENEFLEFRFTPQTTEFLLIDKASGAQWHSNPPDALNDPLADTVTSRLLCSQFSLQYADVAGVGTTLFSSEHSVDRNAFEYALADGALEIRYAVGDLARSYLFPAAAPEGRMSEYLNKMEREDRRKVESSFRLYDINNLRENDDKNSLLAMYPDLADGKVYILRDNTQEYMKDLIEQYFAAAGYTYSDYLSDAARYSVSGGTDKPAFNVTLRYTLDKNSLLLTVPFDSIAYRPAYPITELSLLPFMGAGGIRDEGYLFVPDGCGALICFNNGKQNQIPYSVNVYGWDEAMPRDAVVSDTKAPFPVFGIQKNGSALLCVIEEGASNAGVRADVSGRNCSWNSVYPRFEMIHGAKMDISGRSDKSVYLYENGLPSGESIVLRYTPCKQPGYIGMAHEYRNRLLEKYAFPAYQFKDSVPIAVEITGAVNKTRHRLGIPFDLPLKLTSYKETEDMMHDFSGFGWKNVHVKLTGWFNRSVDHSVPTRIKLIGELGNKKEFLNIAASAKQCGYELFPEADFLYMKDLSLFDGFSLYRDAARYVNRKRAENYPFSIVWFGERTQWGKLSHVARPAAMMSMIDNFSKKAAALGLRNIAFRNMGGKLCGDYNEKRRVSREAAMRGRQEQLARISKTGTKIMLDTGFDYAAPWASFITGMAVDDQGFGITDVSVPFYPIALHGLVPFAGKAVNLAEDYMKNLLKTVECGAGLYFSFMTEETAALQETKFRQYYANEYHLWINDANVLYQKFSSDFSGLYSQAITDHKILSTAVTLTEYEDGTRVIVNAGPGAWNYRNGENNGVIVNGNDYIVLRRGD